MERIDVHHFLITGNASKLLAVLAVENLVSGRAALLLSPVQTHLL